MPKAKFIAGVAIIAGAIIWLAATGFEGAQAYYKTVDELYQMGDDAYKYRLKVAGQVVEGSIARRQGRVDFVISQKGKDLKVCYSGDNPLPDTFKDHAQVVVEGRYRREGDFQAEALQAKCASKYEAMDKGEPPAPAAPASTGL